MHIALVEHNEGGQVTPSQATLQLYQETKKHLFSVNAITLC